MNALNFFKIDWVRSKSQSKLIPVFAVIMIIMSIQFENPFWTIGYFCFFAVIFSTTPFTVQNIANSGFINMLPATTLSRVIGRYFFGLSMSVIGIILGEITIIVYYLYHHSVPQYIIPISVILFSITLIINSIQYFMFYTLGNIKSKQLMAIIQMVPGFIMFFGVSLLSDYINETPDLGVDWLKVFMENINIISVLICFLALLIIVIGVILSNAIVNKKN